MLGHSATKVTERYAHLSPDHLHRLAARTARTCPTRDQDLTGDDDATDDAPDRNRTCGPRLRRPREVVAGHGVSPDLGTTWAQAEQAAAETLLRLAAAGEPVPGSVLEVLGVGDGDFRLRRGVERARDVLLGNKKPAIGGESMAGQR